ncbi:FG-GAP repeat domain-containing protein [Planctomycetota bacterium]
MICLLSTGCLGPIYGIYEITKEEKTDKNRAPVVTVSVPSRVYDSSIVPVTYKVSDSDRDATSITIRYNDNDTGWTTCVSLGAAVSTGTPGEYIVDWDAATDLGDGLTRTNMKIAVQAYDGEDFSLTAETDSIIIGNHLPTVVITVPADGDGNIVIDYTLEDPAADSCSVFFRYGLSGTGPWLPCTPASAVAVNPEMGVISLPTAVGHSYAWNTQALTDLPNQQEDVWLQLTVDDGGGTPQVEATLVSFEVNNNGLPYGTFLTTSMVLYDQHGIVTVPYRIQDPEGDLCTISMQYSREDETGWHDCTEFPARMSDGKTGLSSFILPGDEKDGEHLFLWNSIQDLGRVDVLCELRLQVADSALNTSGWVLKGIPMANAGPCVGEPTYEVLAGNYTDVMVADLDNDGYADVVVSDFFNDALDYSYGSGTGHTLPISTFGLTGMLDPSAMAAADMNGDGFKDIIVGSSQVGNMAVVYTGPGAPVTEVNLVSQRSPNHIAVGDINGDGYDDFAYAAQYQGTIAISYGSGAGHTAPLETFAAASPQWADLGDVNGDGLDDIVFTRGSGNEIGYDLGTGTGAELNPTFITVVNVPQHIAAGDFNGDGVDDVVISKDATCEAAVIYGVDTVGLSTTVNVIDFGIADATAHPQGLVVADINADGYDDFAMTVDKVDLVCYCLGGPTGVGAPQTMFPSGLDPAEVEAGDINGDGYADLLISSPSSNTLSLCMGSPIGLVEPAPSKVAANGPRDISVGDINGDGFTDMVTLGTGGGGPLTLTFLYGQHAYAQLPAEHITRNSDVWTGVARDFNMDGYTDIVNHALMQTDFYHSYGSAVGHLDFYDSFPSTITTWYLVFVSGDFDRDGYFDVVSGSTGGISPDPDEIAICYGGMDGLSETPDLLLMGDKPRDLVAGDIDLDGFDDLVTSNYGTDDFSVSYGEAGGLVTAEEISVGDAPGIPSLADINGDGWLEILIPNENDGTMSINVGVGPPDGHSPACLPALTTAAGAHEILAADVNMDGFMDLMCICPDSDVVTVHYGTLTGHADPADAVIAVGDNPNWIRSGDFNGDGFPDVACINQDSDNASIMYGSRTGLQPAVNVTTSAQPFDLVVYDMNGDGFSDMGISNFSGANINIIYGGPKGHGEPFALDIGDTAIGLFSGDLNHDGSPDLLGGSPVSKSMVAVLGETVQACKAEEINAVSTTDVFRFRGLIIDFPIGAFTTPVEVTVRIAPEDIKPPHTSPGTADFPLMPVSFPWDIMRKDVQLALGKADLTIPVKPNLPADILEWGTFVLYCSHWGADRIDHRDDVVVPVSVMDESLGLADPVARTVTTPAGGGIDRFGTYQLFLKTDDTEGDGLPDAWEIKYFGAIDALLGGPGEDFDSDGSTNLIEYQAGTNPDDDLDFP